MASWPAGSWMPSPPNLILPNRQANQAGFYGAGQIWSVGGLVGQTFQFLAEVQRRSNGGGPCGTPTATPTATPHSLRQRLRRQLPHSRQRRQRQQRYIDAQRRLRQQRLQPRQLRPYRRGLHRRHGLGRHRGGIRAAIAIDSSDCTGFPKTDTLTCVECLVRQGGMSWLDGSGCHTTCP